MFSPARKLSAVSALEHVEVVGKHGHASNHRQFEPGKNTFRWYKLHTKNGQVNLKDQILNENKIPELEKPTCQNSV